MVIENEKALVKSQRIDKRDKYFNEESVKKILAICDDVKDRAYIIFSLETGLRVSEVVGSKFVGWEKDRNKIRIYDQKKKKHRTIMINDTVKGALFTYLKIHNPKQEGEYIFPFSKKTANRIIKYWAKKADLPNSSLASTHWFRHTFVRLSRKKGRDMKFIQQQTGDKVSTILEWYSELDDEEMEFEMSKPLINY